MESPKLDRCRLRRARASAQVRVGAKDTRVHRYCSSLSGMPPLPASFNGACRAGGLKTVDLRGMQPCSVWPTAQARPARGRTGSRPPPCLPPPRVSRPYQYVRRGDPSRGRLHWRLSTCQPLTWIARQAPIAVRQGRLLARMDPLTADSGPDRLIADWSVSNGANGTACA